MQLIDTHCHLDFEAFDADRNSLVSRCREKGLVGFILPGVVRKGWRKLITLAEGCSSFRCAPGLHPCFIETHQPHDLKELRSLVDAHRNRVVAIGEIGLDFFQKPVDLEQQYFYFEEQIRVAVEYGLPLILHVRKAHDEVLATIKRLKHTSGGIVHCYSGSLQQAERYIDAGFKAGIGGVITYENAHRLHTIARSLPLSAFVLETDAPDIPPAGYTGAIHTPETLPDICRAFGQYRDEPFEIVHQALYRNTVSLFPGMEA